MKLNNRGMSIIEIVVTFTLIMVMVISMFTIVMNYRDKASLSLEKMEMDTFKNTLTRDIQNDISKLGIKEINNDGQCLSLTNLNRCVNIVFQDGSEKAFGTSKLDVNKRDSIENKFLYYGGEKYKLKDKLPDTIPTGRSILDFQSIMVEDNNLLSVDSTILDDGTVVSIYSIDVYVSHVDFDLDFGIHIVATDEVFESNDSVNKNDIYLLGNGTSFNIKELYPDIDYTKLTVNNFISGITSGSNTYTAAEMISGVNIQGWANGFTVTKSYNSETGIFSISGTNQRIALRHDYSDSSLGKTATQNLTPTSYLVLGDIKNNSSDTTNSTLYNLGTGGSFNIKTLYPDIDYTKLTADDFIVGVASGSNTYTAAQMISGVNMQGWANGFTITKTYNAETGVLTLGGTSQRIAIRHNYSDSSLGKTANQGFSCFAYLSLNDIK